MSEKLQKVLARAGVGSRREMETVISEGRVSVNGKTAKLGDRVTAADSIRVDSHVVKVPSEKEVICRVLAYYKPEGEVCTRHDPEGRPTVFERLPYLQDARWIAVGRLDVNTSGLLLFTTDGELANRLMHPSHEVEREYAVRVFGDVTEQILRQLRQGVQLEDGPAKFDQLNVSGGSGINQWYNVILSEGRNREVRRLWEAVGLQVSRLMRVRYGDILLDKSLPRGGWRELALEQVNYLRKMVGLPEENRSKVSLAEQDVKQQYKQAVQIRRAVRRHRERSLLDDESTGVEVPARHLQADKPVSHTNKGSRKPVDEAAAWDLARQRLRDDGDNKRKPRGVPQLGRVNRKIKPGRP